ncbi:MAG: helicase-exonuclease AddAB subunit AddB [Clostridia bacterium]|nr:helicase-exonuclease AddAB subunit AddB [Clostridia bacterium]
MSLRIVYGTAGTGKSTYLFQEIQEKLKQKQQENIKVITPEQFSFTLEKKLLDFAPSSSVLSAEVITFNRMAYRILEEVGGKTKKHLTKSGRVMLLDEILLSQKNDFTFLGKTDENIEMIGTQITELKKHQVSVDTLKEITKNTQDVYLQKKLQDIYKIYETYTARVQNQYIDENDNLTILAENLEQSSQFQNCDIYLDEFVGFTLQEYHILRKLLKLSKRVTITVCADNLEENTNPDHDSFYANKQTAARLMKIAREENIFIEEPIHLEEKMRFHTLELKHLAENMGEAFYHKYEKEVQNLSVFLANNPYSEIEHIAIEITKLVKEKGYRYEDIAVITKDIGTYGSLCKAIFNSYHIPVFMDEEKDLSENVLIKWILSLLDIFVKNWSYEAVLGYIKTGFTNLEGHEVSLLENYSLKWGLKGSKWYAKEWKFYDELDDEKQIILYAKEQVVEPVMRLKEQLKGLKTVKQITKSLYNFMLENHIPEILEKKIAHLEKINELERMNEYITSWKVVTQVLEELIQVLGEEEITFERYSKILKMGFEVSHLGAIPGTADQVIIGDTDRSRSHKVKAVFIIGLNDGSFPGSHKEEGFLDDRDRQTLKEQGIELAKGTMEQLYDDHFNIYKAFTTAEEKLYLSYVSSDSEGKSLRPSIMLNKVKRMFPMIQEESDVVERKSEILLAETTFDELLIQLRKFQEGEEIDKAWFQLYRYYQAREPEKLANSLKALQYKNVPEKLQKTNLEKLYGNTLKTSISRLEQYEACAFSYYLKYGLKLQEQSTFQVGTIDTGNFMHEVIDCFFDYLEERELSVKQLTEEQVAQITEEIVQEKLALKKYDIFQSIPKYRVLAQRLKKVVLRSMEYIVNSLKYSEFEVFGHEMEFKQGKDYEPIILELQDGKRVEITGKIDRVDIAKTPEGNYIRIIDYKSSIKNIDLNEVLAGLQLQLLTYLDATCKKEDVLPAGVFYFPLIDPILNSDRSLAEEQIKEELQKQFKMKGLILADVNVVKKMDTNLVSGNSNIVPAYINKEGEVSDKASTLNRKQFENLQNYMEKILKQISKEILEGNIKIEPYYQVQNKKTPCEYCSYKSICQFNQVTKNDYRYISNNSKEYVLEQMKK